MHGNVFSKCFHFAIVQTWFTLPTILCSGLSHIIALSGGCPTQSTGLKVKVPKTLHKTKAHWP